MMSLASGVAALAVLPMSNVEPLASWGATAQYEIVDSFSTQTSHAFEEFRIVGSDAEARSEAHSKVPTGAGYSWVAGPYSSSSRAPRNAQREAIRYLYGASAVEVGLPAVRVARSLYAQEAYLSALGNDWDGYGAAELDRGAIASFFAELRSLNSELPDRIIEVVPGGDGSLQAEWRHQGYLLTYGRTEDAEVELCLSFAGELLVFLSGDSARSSLAPMLRHVFYADASFARSAV